MLRGAGDFGTGGGRPPVNIEVNFVPGSGPNALKEAREDAKALKAELDALRGHSMLGGPGVGSGGGVSGVTGASGVASAAPTFVPGGRRRFSSAELSSEASETVRATQRITEANRGLAASAREVATAYVAMNTASSMAGGINIGGGGGPTSTAGMRPIDILQANIERRRRGLPDLPDPTIAAAAAVGARGAGGAAGAGGAFLAGGLALPAAMAAAVFGGLAANTTQGVESIGGFGNWLSSVTGEGSFLDQMIVGDRSRRRPGEAPGLFELFRRDVLGPFSEQAQSQAGVERMLQGQSLAGTRHRLGQLGELSMAGFGMDPMAELQAQNALRTRQLESNVWDRASGGPELKIQEINALQDTYRESLNIERQKLAIQQSTLDMRLRERDAVEKMVSAQYGGLAGMKPGDLRKLERDFQNIRGGSQDLAAANRLDRAGFDLPQVKAIQEQYVREIAPGLSKYLEDFRTIANKSVDEQKKVFDELAGSFKKMSDTLVEKMAELKTLYDTTTAELTTQKTNTSVKNKQGVRAPGVAGR